jgi:hypothetical protein
MAATPATALAGTGEFARSAPEGGSPQPTGAQVCRLRVYLDVVAPLAPAQVDAVRGQVDAIWRPYGVAFDWDDAEPQAGTSGRGLHVMLEPSRASGAVAAVARPAPLGAVAFRTPVRPLELIRMTVPGPELLAVTIVDDRPLTTRPKTLQDGFIAQALGRGLAHEIGHYLLATRQHTRRGLMRATFRSADLFARDLGPFRLEEAQAAQLASIRISAPVCAHAP